MSLSKCREEIRKSGKPYPRSCPICRFGPCPFGHEYGAIKLKKPEAMTADTPALRVLLPAEATRDQLIAGVIGNQERMVADVYAAMIAAAPSAGAVSKEELDVAYEAAKSACERCTQNFCGDCDCDGFTCKEGIRAALSSIGIKVE